MSHDLVVANEAFAKGLLSIHRTDCVRGGHKSVFMSQKGLLMSEAPAGFMKKDLVRQGSCHFTGWSWHSSHCVAHGALEEPGRIWPSFFLSAFLASMCILPSPEANISNKLLALGKSWEREATSTYCIRRDSRRGTEHSPGSPSAGEQRESRKKGKAKGDKQAQERATPCIGMWTLSRGYENTSNAITCQ